MTSPPLRSLRRRPRLWHRDRGSPSAPAGESAPRGGREGRAPPSGLALPQGSPTARAPSKLGAAQPSPVQAPAPGSELRQRRHRAGTAPARPRRAPLRTGGRGRAARADPPAVGGPSPAGRPPRSARGPHTGPSAPRSPRAPSRPGAKAGPYSPCGLRPPEPHRGAARSRRGAGTRWGSLGGGMKGRGEGVRGGMLFPGKVAGGSRGGSAGPPLAPGTCRRRSLAGRGRRTAGGRPHSSGARRGGGRVLPAGAPRPPPPLRAGAAPSGAPASAASGAGRAERAPGRG